jgi:hypothetical protein
MEFTLLCVGSFFKKLNDGTFNPNSNVSNKSIVNPFYARIIVQNIFFCCCQNFKIKMRENSGHIFFVCGSWEIRGFVLDPIWF